MQGKQNMRKSKRFIYLYESEYILHVCEWNKYLNRKTVVTYKIPYTHIGLAEVPDPFAYDPTEDMDLSELIAQS
jgi:hypothetical protein